MYYHIRLHFQQNGWSPPPPPPSVFFFSQPPPVFFFPPPPVCSPPIFVFFSPLVFFLFSPPVFVFSSPPFFSLVFSPVFLSHPHVFYSNPHSVCQTPPASTMDRVVLMQMSWNNFLLFNNNTQIKLKYLYWIKFKLMTKIDLYNKLILGN